MAMDTRDLEAAAWTGGTLSASQDWTVTLTSEQIEEIDGALRAAQSTGRRLEEVGRTEFPLPGLEGFLAGLAEEIERGRGFVLLRGLPIERYGEDESALIFWGLGTHLGTAVPQSRKGDLLGHVRDLGGDIRDPTVRGYETRARLLFHTDRCDCVGLLCLAKPKSGGASRVASAVSVYRRIGEQRPDLLETLCAPFFSDRRGEQPPGAPPVAEMPVFMADDGVFAVRYVRDYIEDAQRFPDVPRLTARQVEALDMLDRTADALALDMDFEPGDMQFLNSYLTLHSRSEFEDFPEPERRRHLLRLWLAMPNSRRLPAPFKALYGTVEAGQVRGGVPVPAAG